MPVLISDYKRPNRKLSCFSFDFWEIIGSYNDYWFHLVTQIENKLIILAKCSVSIESAKARIEDVFVPTKYRGNGYAYQLIREVIDILKKYDMNEDIIYLNSVKPRFGLETVYLIARKDNISANRTYEKIFGKAQKEFVKEEINFYFLIYFLIYFLNI